MDQGTAPASGRVYALAGAGVFVAAALLRLAGLFDDFWLDEIWSWRMSRGISSAAAVFTELRHDNNHWLNTLFLYAVGPQHWYIYRLPSLVAGVLTLAVAWRVGRQDGPLEAALTLVLVGLCYLLVHYASEARGYASAVLFALTCLYLLREQLRAPTVARALLFSASAALGFLSHFTFLYPYTGMFVWSAGAAVRRGSGRAAAYFALMHALPAAVVAFLYVVNLRHLVIGGGDPRPLWVVLHETVVWSLGTPDHLLASAAAAAIALAALLGEALARDRPWEESLGYVTAVVIAPALTLFRAPEALYPRYFLLAVPFLLVVLARALARGLRGPAWARLGAATLLVAFCAGNAWHTYEFLKVGRGDYRGAIRYLVERTPGPVVSVGSTHDFRTVMVLAYYAEQEPPGKEIDYVPRVRWSRTEPHWILLNRFNSDPEAPPALAFAEGSRYTFDRTFPYAGPSGWAWHVYRLQAE